MSEWPSKIEGNEFSLVKLDPETPPAEMRVLTWSNVFGEGGNVSIEGFDADGKRFLSNFGSITIKSSGSVLSERQWLQDIADEFTADLPNNWRTLIEGAREYILAYYRKQSGEYAEKLAAAERGEFA